MAEAWLRVHRLRLGVWAAKAAQEEVKPSLAFFIGLLDPRTWTTVETP